MVLPEGGGGGGGGGGHMHSRRPNFVLILTDDQDTRLGSIDTGYTSQGSMEIMTKTQSLLGETGLTALNMFVHTPICCPSRAELFSGRYYHNLGAPNGTCMHVDTEGPVFGNETSIFHQFQNAGYETGVFGKVTNDQKDYFCDFTDPSDSRSDGMSTVFAPCDFNDYYGHQYFEKTANGEQRFVTLDDVATSYQTAQIGNYSIDWIREQASSDSAAPFFAYIGPHAPHYPATPAPWYADLLNETRAPRTPNWNHTSTDKHAMIAGNPALTKEAATFIDQHHRDRWRTLLSVDDIIEGVVETLDEAGVLENTFILYTSDHGYHLGQWRVGTSKEQPYETDIRVPFLLRGPGVAAASTSDAMIGNVDVVPTLLSLAGIPAGNIIDGRDMSPILVTENRPEDEVMRAREDWRDAYMFEYKSVGTYFNDHSTIWWPGGESETFPHQGYTQAGPEKMNGVKSYCDDEQSNSWRALRVHNASANLMFTEFDIDVSLQWNFANVSFVELFDLDKDPMQMTNLAATAEAATLQSLHDQLDKWFRCSGLSCP